MEKSLYFRDSLSSGELSVIARQEHEAQTLRESGKVQWEDTVDWPNLHLVRVGQCDRILTVQHTGSSASGTCSFFFIFLSWTVS